MLVCLACFIWAITRTVQVFTVYPLSWLFAYKFFQFPWWVGRELRAKALLARKRACTPVLNSSCRSRALGSESLMPSPWLHWALLISCLPQENWHGPKPLTLKQPGWSWDSIVSSTTALVHCVLWAYPELLTPRFWWQLCGSESCVAVTFPGWPKSVKSRLFNAPKVQVSVWAPEICHWDPAASPVH